MPSQRRRGWSRRALAAGLLALIAAGTTAAAEAPTGSVVLLDFENPAQVASLRLGPHTRIEPVTDAAEGQRAAKMTFAAVPAGRREYPAVILDGEALPVRDWSRFEALSLWVKNPGPDEAELALAVWDAQGRRAFPVPSAVTVPPGRWQNVVCRLVLHGLDAKNIGSVHFYQKVNRRPVTLLLDDVRLLSPHDGRIAARILAARQALARARNSADALGARDRVEPTIAGLLARLDRLAEPAAGAQRTDRLAELARVATAAQQLAGAIAVRNNGRDVGLTGPQVRPDWLSNPDGLRRAASVRLFETPLDDDALAHLAAAPSLETLIVRSPRVTGSGLAKLPGGNLRRLGLPGTRARDDALTALREFRQLRDLELNETSVTAGVLRHLEGLDQLRNLRLSGSGVADAGFEAIGRLTGLEALDLERTAITGASLRHLAGLTRLKALDLRRTRIDDAGLTQLGALTRLEALALEGTPITGAGFRGLSALTNLAALNLNGTRVGDSALRQLGRLPKLKRLELSGTRVTDGSLGPIAAAAQLQYLDLYGTNVTDAGLVHLRNQRGLTDLYLAGTQASDAGLAHLAGLRNLEQLDLTGTRVTDAGLKHLAGMTKLVTLRLGKTALTGTGLQHLAGLTKLQELDLSGTNVADEALAAVGHLEALRSLDLSGTRVTGAGMRHLQRAGKLGDLHLEATGVGDAGLELLAGLPNLSILTLNETPVTDTGLKHLRGLEKLDSLALNQTRITDAGLALLGDRLSTLELNRTRITDAGLEHLQRHDRLMHLRLAATGVTDNGLRLLRATPNLRQLDLAETGVTDAGLDYLALLPELKQLRLDGTAVSDVGLDALLKVPGLRELSLENARVTAAGSSYLKARAPQLDVALVFPWAVGERWSRYPLPDGPTDAAALPAELQGLAGLASLHLTDALLQPHVLRSLKDLPALEHLSFRGAALTDELLAELIGLSQVARLDLAHTRVTDRGLEQLKDLRNLRELSLQGTRVTGGGFPYLAGLTRLQALDLRETPVDDAGLASLTPLTGLRKLELSSTRITDTGIDHLARLPHLQYLDLYGTAVTDAGLALVGQMASLRYCYISRTAVTDTGIAHLSRLTGLEELGLDGTGLTDAGLAAVRSLPGLRRLRIGGTRVTDAGLAQVAALPNLARLELNDLPLTSAGVAALRPLTRLRVLDLSATHVGDDVLPTLAALPVLEDLILRDTAVTPPAVEQFRRERPAVAVVMGTTPPRYSPWAVGLAVVYGLIALAICVYGSHRVWLTWRFVRDAEVRAPREPKGCFTELPRVTVQLPMFNERRVAERVIEAACALDYPRDRLQIQVLDDSTDASADVARRCCDRLAAAGHPVEYLHRPARHGFKGGALAAGLERATGELVAIFDADFVPPADFLRQTVHHFTDPQVGVVQAEWSHLNRGESLLTELQALFLDGHFVVEQSVRSHCGRWFNFNGTAGIWRRRCIDDAGGWHHDTLTEDTDLSYRAQLKGWRFVYLPTVRCDAELPATMTAFLGQQHRWTKGLIQNAKKLLPRILLGGVPWRVKLEAWFHLTAPVMYLVMLVLTALALPALFLATPLTHRPGTALALGLATLGLGTLAAALFYVVAQRARGAGVLRTVLKVPVLMALGIGMSAVNGRAVVEALFGLRSPFVRTPKFGGRADCDPDPAVARRRLRLPAGLVELAAAGVLFACFALCLVRPYTLIGAPFLLLFAAGYAGVGTLALLDRYGGARVTGLVRPRLRPALLTATGGLLAVVVTATVAAATLALAVPPELRTSRAPVALGVDLTAAPWHIVGERGAVRRLDGDRGALVLAVQLDETTDQGEIVLDLDGALRSLGDALGGGRELAFAVEYPARFTGELQAWVKDRRGRSEYGSMHFVETHDTRRAVTVALVPTARTPAMGYRQDGFDPAAGIAQVGLKVGAQSDRVRGAGYRPFRGTIRIAKVRIAEVDRAAHPEPEVRPVDDQRQQPLSPLTPEQFAAGSGVDRPWPLGYAFSGPLTPAHQDELERTYAALARLGLRFTRVYVGDYRTGVVYDGQGRATGIEPEFLNYLDGLAATANRHGITVMFALTDNTIADGKGQENVEWLRAGERSQAFIDTVLARIIERLKGRRVVWDVFNEPENVTAVPLREVQGYVERVLAAGRRADPAARFTVVSRSRADLVYWQGRGLDLYSHNVFTADGLAEAVAAPRSLDAPILVAEMAPALAAVENLAALRDAGYAGVGVWGWGTGDKYHWDAGDLERVAEALR